MTELKICRICLDNKVRMHQISGSEVQNVYEKLTTKKVQDGRLHFACYICYYQLKKCQQLVIKSQKAEELLQQFFVNTPEQIAKTIALLDRPTHGLHNSLTIGKIEAYQIPENNMIIKTENEDEYDTIEVIIKQEPDDDGTHFYKTPKLDETLIFKQEESNFVDSVKKENNYKPQTQALATENKALHIVCGENKAQELDKHDKTSFICNDCGQTCDTKALLSKHITEHNPGIMKPNEIYIKIEKSICDEKFKENNASENDFDNQKDKKRFKCNYCNYACALKANLKRHINTHTGEKPYKCQYCNQSFTQKGHLVVHIRTHTGIKPYKCQYCNYTCTAKGNLRRHIRIHTGEKPFKCQYCNYSCYMRSHLQEHTRTHTGEKPFKCQYCNYACKRQTNLNIHIRSHTGEKPFKCQYCNYICYMRSHLQQHIRTHTGEKPFKCQHCNYASKRHSYLKTHIKTHTGEVS